MVINLLIKLIKNEKKNNENNEKFIKIKNQESLN